MIFAHSSTDYSTNTAHLPIGDRLLEAGRLIAIVWLLLVGLWSGPSYGSLLVYPLGLLSAEIALAVILILSAVRGRVRPLREYPFFWPSLAALLLCAVAAGLRVHTRGTTLDAEFLLLWRHGEPMLRGLLLFLAIAGQPKLARVAWVSLLGGLLLQVGAAIIQHFTHVTRWYADLDTGWASGFVPTQDATTVGGIAPRVQGLTSYINTTAAMFAASLPFWAIPPALRIPASRWWRIALMLGGIATTAALWYTNSRGPMMAVGLMLIVLLWQFAWPWRFSILAAIAAFLLAVMPGSPRVAVAAFLASIILIILARGRHARYLLPVVLALGMAGGVQVVDAYLLHYELNWRIGARGMEDNARTVLYTDALRAAASSPWCGIGETAVADYILNSRYPGLRILPKSQYNFHNQYLHWAAVEGVPVALAFTLLVWGAVGWCWRQASRWTEPFARAVALATAAGLTIYLLANLVDAHFWRMEGAGFFWSILAVTVAIGRTRCLPDRQVGA